MSVEALTYRLTSRGRPAGNHVLRQETRGGQAYLEARTTWEGVLAGHTLTQRSRCGRDDPASFEFHEREEDRQGAREFHVTFDAEQGLVTAHRSTGERADVPYLNDFRDPLSMLREIRTLGGASDPVRIPMLGKTVSVFDLGEEILEVGGRQRSTHRYQVRPGNAWLWVDREGRGAIVRFTQRFSEGVVEGWLVHEGQESALAEWRDAGGEASESRKRRRRKRRRRKRSRGSGHD